MYFKKVNWKISITQIFINFVSEQILISGKKKYLYNEAIYTTH